MLDEYLGLRADHPASDRQVIERQVVAPLGLDPRRVHHLVLLAWGEGKAEPVARRVEGPVSASTPASALRCTRT